MLEIRPISVDLAPHCNNAGIASCCDPAVDGLDGMGTIFCAGGLPASGTTIACNGTLFVFPDKSDGVLDNIACEGQDIPLPMGCYRALHVLGMCDWRAFAEPLQLKGWHLHRNESWTQRRLALPRTPVQRTRSSDVPVGHPG